MNLNEYGIVRGGLSFTKLDENAHRYAKVFAQSKGISLEDKVVVTTSVKNLEYKRGIANVSRAIFHLDSPVRFDKNGNISVACSLRDKDGSIALQGRLTFTITAKQKLLERTCCKKEKRKVR